MRKVGQQRGVNQLIDVIVTPAREELWASDEPQLVYLQLTGQAGTVAGPRLPLNLCLVLDRSSSMRGERLFQIKEAARQVVDELGPEDLFSLVVFNDRADVVAPVGKGADRGLLHAAINGIEASGGTEMAQGLALGLQQIERPKLVGLSRLVVLTDGRTYGDEQTCVELAGQAQGRGIGITALGVGSEWNEDLLELMTAEENSRTEYITSLSEIVPVFASELRRMRDTIAHPTELIITAPRQAQLRAVHRVQPFIALLAYHAAGQDRWRVPLGPWLTGQQQQFLLELLLPPCAAGMQNVARFELRYEVVGPARTTMQSMVTANASAKAKPDITVAPEVEHTLARLTAYQLQGRAWQAVAEGRVEEATRALQRASTHLLHTGQTDLAATINSEVTHLLRRGTASPEGRKRIRYGTRGLVTRQVHG